MIEVLSVLAEILGVSVADLITRVEAYRRKWSDGRIREQEAAVRFFASPDALAQAEVVLRRLTEETSALDPKPRIHLVLNQVQTLGERIAITGQASTWIKFDPRRADRLDSVLAEPLLELLYPGWKKQGKTA